MREGPWTQPLRQSLVLLAILAAAWLVWQAAPLIEALIIAVLLAILLNPLVAVLNRKTRLSRPWAGTLVFALFLTLLAGLPAIAGTLAVGQFRRLGVEIQEATNALQDFLARPISLFGFTLYPQVGLDYLERISGNTLASIPGGSLDLLSGVTANLLWGLVILVSLFYLLKEGHKVKPWLIRLVPPGDLRHDAELLLDEIEHVWVLFFRVQLLIFFILAILFALGTLFVVILFRTGLLPFSFLALVVLLVLVYTLVQQVDNLWLRPQLLGRRMGLHPGIVVIALIGALGLSGVLGAIIVVPCLGTLKVVWRHYNRRISGDPRGVPSDDDAVDGETVSAPVGGLPGDDEERDLANSAPGAVSSGEAQAAESRKTS